MSGGDPDRGPAAGAASAAPAEGPKSAPADPGQREINKVGARWALFSGVVGWLVTVIGPAISFKAKLHVDSDWGTEFKAYFLIVTTILFLLVWRRLRRVPVWGLVLLGAISLGSFLAYGKAKDDWTCLSYLDPAPLVMGSETAMKSGPKAHLARKVPPPITCKEIMEPWSGDSYQIWEKADVRNRFLALFGLYALAWLSLAILLVGAARRSLESWSGKQ